MTRLVSYIGFGILWAWSASSAAQHQCWIERVEQVSDGVKIFFAKHPVQGMVRKQGDAGGEGFYYDAVRDTVKRGNRELNHLFLAYGLEVSFGHMHSGCNLAIETRENRVWLAGYGSNAMPGLPPQRMKVDIEVGEPTTTK